MIETNRGHHLGRVYWKGRTDQDTGVPDAVLGQDKLRVLRAAVGGVVQTHADIGDTIAAGQIVATAGEEPVRASINGVLRGIIADGTVVSAGVKIGDIDPRARRENCFTVSDKSLAVGGGVLEAVLFWLN